MKFPCTVYIVIEVILVNLILNTTYSASSECKLINSTNQVVNLSVKPFTTVEYDPHIDTKVNLNVSWEAEQIKNISSEIMLHYCIDQGVKSTNKNIFKNQNTNYVIISNVKILNNYTIMLVTNASEILGTTIGRIPRCIDNDCCIQIDRKMMGHVIYMKHLRNNSILLEYNITDISYKKNYTTEGVYRTENDPLGSVTPIMKRNLTEATKIGNFTIHNVVPGLKYDAFLYIKDSYNCTLYMGETNELIEVPLQQEFPYWFPVLLGILTVSIIVIAVIYVTLCAKVKNRYSTTEGVVTYSSDRSNAIQNAEEQYCLQYNSKLTRNVLYSDKTGNTEDNEDSSDYLYLDGKVDSKFGNEIDRNNLKIIREIGRGTFGLVFSAEVSGLGPSGKKLVAVKKLNDFCSDAVDEFLGEIEMLKRAGRHPHIVNLIGSCTKEKPYLMIIEYVPHGNLQQYLQKLRYVFERTRQSRFSQKLTPTRMSISSDGSAAAATPTAYASVRADTTDDSLKQKKRKSDIHSSSCSSSSSSSSNSKRQPMYTKLCNNSQYYFSERRDSDSSYLTPISAAQRNKDELNGFNNGRHGSTASDRTIVSPESGSELETCEIDIRELQNFAQQIARGMSHLEKMEITHRDLAARNILIGLGKTLKITDFGLSRRGVYVNTRHRTVPLRWLSIEAIRDHFYSNKSDVWAFGVVLWEIATLGGFPYYSIPNEMLQEFLTLGHRLEKPPDLSNEMYALMMRCWADNVDDRPSFAELVDALDAIGRRDAGVRFDRVNLTYVLPPLATTIRSASITE